MSATSATSSLRTLRPLARAIQRQPLAVARPAFAAAFSTKSSTAIAPFTPSISAQLQSMQHAKPVSAELPVTQRMHVLQAGMPQLVPFYFVNETVTAWILLPVSIYVLGKYVLPQNVRRMAARFFISKL